MNNEELNDYIGQVVRDLEDIVHEARRKAEESSMTDKEFEEVDRLLSKAIIKLMNL